MPGLSANSTHAYRSAPGFGCFRFGFAGSVASHSLATARIKICCASFACSRTTSKSSERCVGLGRLSSISNIAS